MKRLLIGSCGGLTGIYLAKQYRSYDELIVYGSDANRNSTGRFFVKDLINLPSSDDLDFIDCLINALNENDVDYYIPTHSHEIIAVSKNADYIKRKTKAAFIVSPYSTYETLNQKDIAYKNLREIGLNVPDVYTDSKVANYPCFYKRKVGSGSQGTGMISNREEFEAIFNEDHDVFVCRYLKGSEYTVDCLFDFDGRLLGYNQRRRVKSMGGAVSITTNENPVDILTEIQRMSQKYKFCGCINFQYILVDDTPYFIDINLRFAAGGLPLTVKSGVNVPEAYIRLLNGEKIGMNEYQSDFKPRTMYRYFEEIYDDRSI